MVKQELKKMVADATLEFVRKGLTLGKDGGDISVRDDETGYIYISPRPNKDLKIFTWATITEEQISIIDLEGNDIEDSGYRPTVEYPMHLAIYKARPDVKAIIHSHALWSSVFACANKPIPSICVEMDGTIPCAEFGSVGSKLLADNIVKAMGKTGKQCLMANHGAVVCGRDLDEAFIMSDYMERQAEITVYASLLGGAREIRHEDMLDGWVQEIGDELALY
ncbi:class II aldolase/adducin family protein [Lacrimispora sp. NSJ-141]|uniref:Class II aldolase/adducin family protein n=1 Tax=Lientehia hominis TaxID=2897778 RepID=A0AAP2W8N3_9FIRM|nr:class II aldolase/adducin family protein [Lientehia hominis]MCD2493738.1 class II aldolase/adducin family protein [Lientehia hominis]